MRVIVTLILVFASLTLGAEEMTEVKGILFRGLSQVDKLTLVRGALRKKAPGLLVSEKIIDENCKRHPLIEKCSFRKNRDVLLVTAVERKVVVRFVISGRDETLVFDVDSNYRVVTGNRLMVQGIPVVFLREEFYGKGLSGELKRMFSLIVSIYKENRPLYDEIKEVRLLRDRFCRVSLKGRGASFRVDGSGSGFKKLGYITGYIDRAGVKAKKVIIDKSAAVIYTGKEAG